MKKEKLSVKKIISYGHEMRELQRDSGSKDSYGVGLFNGIELVLSGIEFRNPEYMTDKKSNFYDRLKYLSRGD